MKKIILLVILLISITSVITYGSDWLEIHGFISGGYLFYGRSVTSKVTDLGYRHWESSYRYDNNLYFTLNTYLEILNVIQIGGEIRSIFNIKSVEQLSFTPFLNRYTFFAKIVVENLEIGFRHYCEHDTSIYKKFEDNKLFDRGEREVYVKFIF
jgi:hypothetical protein